MNKQAAGEPDLHASQRRLGELHLTYARASAIKIHSISTTVVPQIWSNRYIEDLLEELFGFAFNARRLLDIAEILPDEIWYDDFLSAKNIENLKAPIEKNFRNCLNALHHTTGMATQGIQIRDKKVFAADIPELEPRLVIVKTDRYDPITIDLGALSTGFLGAIIPAVKSKKPDWKF